MEDFISFDEKSEASVSIEDNDIIQQIVCSSLKYNAHQSSSDSDDDRIDIDHPKASESDAKHVTELLSRYFDTPGIPNITLLLQKKTAWIPNDKFRAFRQKLLMILLTVRSQ